MRSASTFFGILVAAGATVAQTAADSYPYGYWNVNMTSAKTGTGWMKNLTIYYVNERHNDVVQAGTAFHCSSQWTGATLTEVKHCDDWTLDWGINGIMGASYLYLAQDISWGKGKFVSGGTASGIARDLPLNCPKTDDGFGLDCTGFVKVNATRFSF
ncbi:hypothetical protein GQ53DRAFT_50203 [Thozetella sp. PMI_491]|nr:hypothetical protein GQ53DRAFT_50203 [Thozetella sp. PMI_491]